MKLLAELHWSLPHPLSSAETQFCNQELPNLEMEVQQLKESIQVNTDISILKDGTAMIGLGQPRKTMLSRIMGKAN